MLDSLIILGMATVSLGTISEADGPVEHTFWLRNEGRDTVALVQGYTSCGCTTLHLGADSLVTPADSVAVVLRFNPRGKGGEFLETGTVVYTSKSEVCCQAQRKRVTMSLVGTCVSSEETLLRQFPIALGRGLRLSSNRFDVGPMRPGEHRERTVVVLHTATGRQEAITARLAVTAQMPKGIQHLPVEIATSEGAKLTVTFDVLVK